MPFDLLHQLWGDFFFCFGYRTSDPQTAVHVDGSASPKRSACGFFWLPPFSPLWPT
jgi:hypothetical protein